MAGIASAQTAAEVQTWNDGWAQYQALAAIPLAQRGFVSVTQELSIVITGRPKEVFDIYANVYNAQGLHPFLTGITPIRHTNKRLDFIAYENIPLPDGTIFPGVTIAQQRFHRAQLFYDATTFDVPGIITHQHITFTKIGKHQVQVTEQLTFEAPPEYIQLAAQGGVYAHYAVQQGLKAKIEADLLSPIRFPRWLPSTHHPAAHVCDHDGDEEEDDED